MLDEARRAQLGDKAFDAFQAGGVALRDHDALIDVEEALYQRRLTGQGQDTVRWPPKLMSKINYLAGELGDSDFGPTNQQREVQALLHGQLMTVRQKFDAVVNTDLVAFNKLLRDRGVDNISSRTP